MEINQLVKELVEDWFNQHGNKKNADVKRLISIMNAFLSHDTVKQALYLGSGLTALAILLHYLNDRHEKDNAFELDKLMMQPSTMIVDNIDDIEDWTNIKEEE